MVETRFGPFLFELTPPRLLRDGTEIRLRRRALEALRVLLRYQGTFVDYDSMIAEAWNGTHVSRHTVDVTIAEVRRALGEYSTWVAHRPKGGYALQVPRSEAIVRKGWHFWNQRTRDGCERAIECFTRALAETPSDYRAFEGLSAAYLTLAVFGIERPFDTYPRFLEAHQSAVALGGLRAELRCNHAFGVYLFEQRVEAAEAELVRAIEEKPALGSAYVRLGLLYGASGRFDAALDICRRGHEADSLQPTLAATEVLVRLWQRAIDEAVALGAHGIELHPHLQVMRVNYGLALEAAGRAEEALNQYQIASVISPDLPWLRALEGACQAKLGRRQDARAILEGLLALRRSRYVDAYYMALLRLALGAPDEALTELERACEENSARLHVIDVDPQLDDLRGVPRFRRLLRRQRG